jgi:WD40 repeat protein
MEEAPKPASPRPAAAPDPGTSAGRRIPGYLLTEMLADREDSQTWRGLQFSSGRNVVVKVFHRRGDEAVWGQFRARAEEASRRYLRLESNPHVNRVLEIGFAADLCFLVMELAEGGALQKKLDAGKRLPLEKIVAWFEQALEGLSFLHGEGIFHGDLRPPNLLLDPKGRVMVADYAQLDQERSLAPVSQTYLAPELALALANREALVFDARSDLYSLGTCINSLCKLASEKRGRLDQDLRAILKKCVEADPRRRYLSADQVLEDLKARREGRPVSPLAGRRGYRTRKLLGRNRGTISVVALILGGLSAALVHGIRVNEDLHQQLTYSYVLRAQQFAGRGDLPSAMLCYGQLNQILPSPLARLNVLACQAEFDTSRVILDNAVGVNAVAFSPDGSLVACANRDSTVQVFNLRGEAQGQPLQNGAAVLALAFSPDGKRLAAGTVDSTAWLWDLKSSRALSKALKHPGSVAQVDFMPDGKSFFTRCSDGKLRFFGAQTGEAVRSPVDPPGKLVRSQLSPDGKILLTSEGRSMKFWDLQSGRLVSETPLHQGDVFSVVFSPDGRLVAEGGSDGVVQVWESPRGKPHLSAIVQPDAVVALAFNHDGSLLATGGAEKIVRLWDTVSGRQVCPGMPHQGWINDLRFATKDDWLFSASKDRSVRVWTVHGQPVALPLFHPWPVQQLIFSRDQERFAALTTDGSARLYDRHSLAGDRPDAWTPGTWSASSALSPDGILAAAGDYAGGLVLRNFDTGKALPLVGHKAWVTDLLFTQDGSLLASASSDKSVRLWDAATGKALEPAMEHSAEVQKLAFSPDGSSLASYCSDHSVRIWGPATRELRYGPYESPAAIHSFAVSPDGTRLFIGGEDKLARLWDATNGKELATPYALGGVVSHAAFSPDSQTLMAGGGDSLWLWDAHSHKALCPPIRHSNTVMQAIFSPDSSMVATGLEDGSCRLFNARSGKQLGRTLQQDWGINALAFSADSRLLVTATYYGEVQLWDVESSEPVGQPFKIKAVAEKVSLSGDSKRIFCSSLNINTYFRWDSAWLTQTVEPAALLRQSQLASFRVFDANGSMRTLSIPEWRALDAEGNP